MTADAANSTPTSTPSGIRRKVDDLGRVVIPAGIRRALHIHEGDDVEVSVDGERVVLSRPIDVCVFCAQRDDALVPFRNRLVCRGCLAALGTPTTRDQDHQDQRAGQDHQDQRDPPEGRTDRGELHAPPYDPSSSTAW